MIKGIVKIITISVTLSPFEDGMAIYNSNLYKNSCLIIGKT